MKDCTFVKIYFLVIINKSFLSVIVCCKDPFPTQERFVCKIVDVLKFQKILETTPSHVPLRFET